MGILCLCQLQNKTYDKLQFLFLDYQNTEVLHFYIVIKKRGYRNQRKNYTVNKDLIGTVDVLK